MCDIVRASSMFDSKLNWLQEGYCPDCRSHPQLERHYHVGLGLQHVYEEARRFSTEPSFGNCPSCHYDFSLREEWVMILKPQCCGQLTQDIDKRVLSP